MVGLSRLRERLVTSSSMRGDQPATVEATDPAARAGRAIVFALVLLGAAVMVLPFFYMLTTSLSPASEVFTYPPHLVPSSAHPENYERALTERDFTRYFANTLIVATVATIGVLVLNSIAGYAFARLRFPGRTVFFGLIIVTLMIPLEVTIVPLFALIRAFPLAGGNDLLGQGGTGLLNSYPGLIMPALATTLGIYLLREAFLAIPVDLLEAGRIDGLSEFTIFRRVYLPLVTPALATVAMLRFTETWNIFLWPLVVANAPDMRTVQVGIYAMRGQLFTEWHILMAAVVISSIPPVLIFLVGQRQFVRGVAMTGIKG